MGTPLLEACGDGRFAFVVGKGGVGKTTTAGALAVVLADAGDSVHLISTDPAHSTGDLFGLAPADTPAEPCGPRLRVESFDARLYAGRWTARARPRLSELIASGTWLDDADVDGVLDASLPGMDEVMAALRLAELDRGPDRVVVDTAPAGHTLRLLDAGAMIETWVRPLRAMAEKAAVVASRMTGVPARLSAERWLDDLADAVARYRDILTGAVFLVVERNEPGVLAATDRLLAALAERSLRVGAVVRVGAGPDRPHVPTVALPEIGALDPVEPCDALLRL
ncbi:MAG: ArsA family ATPase, partial [Longimicrobiales bacterium]